MDLTCGSEKVGNREERLSKTFEFQHDVLHLFFFSLRCSEEPHTSISLDNTTPTRSIDVGTTNARVCLLETRPAAARSQFCHVV